MMGTVALLTNASLDVAFQLRNLVRPFFAKPAPAIRRQELVYMSTIIPCHVVMERLVLTTNASMDVAFQLTKFVPPHLLAKPPPAIRRQEIA